MGNIRTKVVATEEARTETGTGKEGTEEKEGNGFTRRKVFFVYAVMSIVMRDRISQVQGKA
jgi:hypothetical protein